MKKRVEDGAVVVMARGKIREIKSLEFRVLVRRWAQFHGATSNMISSGSQVMPYPSAWPPSAAFRTPQKAGRRTGQLLP